MPLHPVNADIPAPRRRRGDAVVLSFNTGRSRRLSTPAPRRRVPRAAALFAAGIVLLLAFAGCQLGSSAITAVTGQPDPNILYDEYSRNYDAYHLD